MEQPGNQPIYEDKPRSALNLRLIVGLLGTLIGFIIMVTGGSPLLFIVGLLILGFSWFTDAKQYQIYTNALVIIYGRPRVKAYPFTEISNLEMLALPMGQRLRVGLIGGGRFLISTANIEEFRDRLDEALAKFNDTYQGQQLTGEEPDNSTPY